MARSNVLSLAAYRPLQTDDPVQELIQEAEVPEKITPAVAAPLAFPLNEASSLKQLWDVTQRLKYYLDDLENNSL